jgi:hypothetical protein
MSFPSGLIASAKTGPAKYVIVAIPGTFKEEWAEHFRDRTVRCFFDNDQGGRKHTERVARFVGESGIAFELKALTWPKHLPYGFDLNDLVRRGKGKSVLKGLLAHCYDIVRDPKLAWQDGWDYRDADPDEVIEWVWRYRLRCGTYASLSGARGTFKSTIARYLIACFTRGEALPECTEASMQPAHVIYLTAEDHYKTAWADFKRLGADRQHLTVLPARLLDGEYLNILEHLDELRQKIRTHGTRLVVIDGQNSVVGAPNICTDMLARTNITNKLHDFAQQENICLVGIRNEDRTGRAYGPASMQDMARCILRCVELDSFAGERFFELHFARVSDVSPKLCPVLPYGVEDLSPPGSPGSARKILWGKYRPSDADTLAEAVRAGKAKTGTGTKADTDAGDGVEEPVGEDAE